MTSVERIVLVPGDATATRVTDAGTKRVPIRQAMRFDDLAAALAGQLGVPAVVDPDWAGLAPAPGTVVVCRADGLWRLEQSGAALPWVVGVDLTRPVLPTVERLDLAAGIDSMDFGAWRSGRTDRPAALYGRLDLAAGIGAVVSGGPIDRGPRHARLEIDGLTDLPVLLARYLANYRG